MKEPVFYFTMDTMHRFYIKQKLEEGNVVHCEQELAHQITHVLRLQKGEDVILFNGSGQDFYAEVEEISRTRCALLIHGHTVPNREPKRKLLLFQALIKKDNFEWVLQKGVEVGVSEFIPMIAARSVKKGFSKERSEKIIQEASEQSGRSFIPRMRTPMFFEEAVRFAHQKGFQSFFPSITATQHERISTYPSKPHVALFIGPEGGWTRDEEDMARKAGFLIISLGKLTLKSETAAIVSAYQLLH